MKKVLVVDDDAELAESLKSILESDGYAVITAKNGDDGFKKAKAEKPAAMVLDVMMTHDTEGFETVRRLREDADTKSLPIVMLTGIRKAKRLPFRFESDPDWLPVKVVLEKPVKPELLLRHVAEAVASRAS